MNIDMHLDEIPFEDIKNDIKDIEYRINDVKRQLIIIGDTITFYKRPLKKESIKVIVTDLKYYKTLLDMYTATFERNFKYKYKSPEDVIKNTFYYSNEEEKKYGCVAIYFKKLM